MKFSFLIYLKRFLKIYSKFLYTTSASPGQQLFPLTEDVQMLCSIGNDVQESLLKILDTISCRLGQRKVNVEVSKFQVWFQRGPSPGQLWAFFQFTFARLGWLNTVNSWECTVADWPPLQGVSQALKSWLLGSTPAALVIKIPNKPQTVNRNGWMEC